MIDKVKIVSAILIPLVVLFVYWPGLYGPILLDDLSVIGRFFDESFDVFAAEDYLISPTGPLGRPVSMLSFGLSAYLSLDLFYWKLANLVLHLFTGVGVFLFSNAIVRSLKEGVKEKYKYLPLVTTLIWIAHPLNVSTVLYTVQRMTILCAMFSLFSFYFYCRLRAPDNTRSIRKQASLFGFCALSFLLALFSKENAFILPVLFVSFEVFVKSYSRIPNRTLALLLLGALAVFVALVVYKFERLNIGYVRRDFNMTERLLTQARVFWDYVSMILAPAQRRMGFFHDGYTVSRSIVDPISTLWSILGLFALLVISFLSRVKHPLFAFGVCFFIVGHIIESTVVGLELVYEHRNYLPAVGLIIAIISLVIDLVEKVWQRKAICIGSLIVLLILLSMRVETWSSEQSLNYYISMVHPESERMAAYQARKWASLEQYDIAERRIRNFHSIGANINRLEIACARDGKLPEKPLFGLRDDFQIVDNYPSSGIVKLANLGLDGDCDFDQREFLGLLDLLLSKTVTPKSNRQLIMMYKAHYLKELGKIESAVEVLIEAHRLDKKNLIPLFLSCEWALSFLKRENYVPICDKALYKNSLNKSSYLDLKEKIEPIYLERLERDGS